MICYHSTKLPKWSEPHVGSGSLAALLATLDSETSKPGVTDLGGGNRESCISIRKCYVVQQEVETSYILGLYAALSEIL